MTHSHSGPPAHSPNSVASMMPPGSALARRRTAAATPTRKNMWAVDCVRSSAEPCARPRCGSLTQPGKSS
jgi:hypothetical protein